MSEIRSPKVSERVAPKAADAKPARKRGQHDDDGPGFKALLRAWGESHRASLAASLEEIATALAARQPVAIHSEEEQTLASSLEQMPDDLDEHQRLIQSQLALIGRQLGPLRTLAAHLGKANPA